MNTGDVTNLSTPNPRSMVSRASAFVLLLLIALYQGLVRPLLIGSCKFCPTCSVYAAEAIQRHGPWHGARIAIGRLLRCHPFTAGGIDPVPGDAE